MLRTGARAKRITTNRVTRSGWFVVGAVLLLPILMIVVAFARMIGPI